MEHLTRAYEIALLGYYSLRPVADLEMYPNVLEDLPLLQSIYTDVWFKPDGDLFVELYPPDCDMVKIDYDKIKTAHSNIKPPREIKGASEILLRTAQERLKLSLHRTELILDIAATIAQLERSKEIKIEHLAEAIQYSYSSLTNILAIKTYTKEEVEVFLKDILNLGMSLRQDQLNGIPRESGNELLEQFIKERL